jgi:putative phosphoribosyl transferase
VAAGVFRNRAEAGALLATEVSRRLSGVESNGIVVLGLPRGGVPVAAAVATALGAPLDVIVVRKLGVPYQPELAMGAIGEGGLRVLNDEVLAVAGVRESDIAEVERRERVELERRAQLYRAGRPPTDLRGKTAVLVDDGIATGSTVAAAAQIARGAGAVSVLIATPVAPPSTIRRLAGVADEVIALRTPEHFFAIGEWYADFSPTSDAEVTRILGRSGAQRT